MSDYVELAKALAWPTALIIFSISACIIIVLLTIKNKPIQLELFDKVKLLFPPSGARLKQEETTITENNTPNSEASFSLNKSAQSEDGEEEETGSQTSEFAANFFNASTVDELELAFDRIKEGVGADNEFIETLYLDERFRLGAGGTIQDLQSLADDNPKWIIPSIHIVRRHVRDQNIRAAESALRAALTRTSAPNYGNAVAEAVEFYFKHFSPGRALAFCLENSGDDRTANARNKMYKNLAALLKDRGDKDGYSIATEIALKFLPSDAEARFALAYSYGEAETRWHAAARHYIYLTNDSDRAGLSHNNLAVLYGHINQSLAFDALESGRQAGNLMAACNVANDLTNAGALQSAKAVLDDIAQAVNDSGVDEILERFAAVKAALLTAQRHMLRRKTDLETLLRLQYSQYQSIVYQSFLHKSNSEKSIFGSYQSSDGVASVQIDSAGAACIVISAGRTIKGVLQDQLLCYAGLISDAATAATILSANFLELTLFQTDDDTVKLIQWPSNVSESEKIRIFELTRLSDLTALEATPSRSEP